MQKKWLFVIVSISLFSVGVFSQSKENSALKANSSPALEKLAIWAGHWKIKGQSMATPYSKAQVFSSDAICGWSANHGYMICDQLIDDSNGSSNALSIYKQVGRSFATF